MPQIYEMEPAALLPLRRTACWGFFRPKNPTASAGFELKASMLPLDHGSRHKYIYIFVYKYMYIYIYIKLQQDRYFMYNVKLRRFCAKILPVEKQILIIAIVFL